MNFHLSPTGDDANDGLAPKKRTTRSGPWATLGGARDALRKLRAGGKLAGPATVLIQDGTYRMTEPIAFGPEDSQTTFAAAPHESHT